MNKEKALKAIQKALEWGHLEYDLAKDGWTDEAPENIAEWDAMWQAAFDALAELQHNPLEALVVVVKKYYDNDWKTFSWEFHFHKDVIQIEVMKVDGEIIDNDDLLHAFYNEVDYMQLYLKNITEVTNE